jgi:type II secretory pathway pseudopilin PulG
VEDLRHGKWDAVRTSGGRPRTRRAVTAGFTLVELMGGVVIAFIALTGIFLTTMSVSQLRRVDEDLNLAFAACRTRLEEIRAMPFPSLPGQHNTGFAVDVDRNGNPELKAPPGDADGLPGRVLVTTEATAGTSVLYRVKVIVNWIGVSGVRTFSLESLVGNRRAE